MVLLVLMVVQLVLSLGTVWDTVEWEGLVLSLCTDLIGAGVTYGLLELVVGRREQREARKANLIAQLGSRVKDVAVAAAEGLQRHGWHHELPGAYLARADLQRADLGQANLQGADLTRAKLERANLEKTELSEDTIFPVGTKWTLGTDLDSFTDPGHPYFWIYDEHIERARKVRAGEEEE